MSKWTRTRRDPGRIYTDEDKERVRKENLRMIQKFIREQDEESYVAALKIWFKDITPEQLKWRITRFWDAVKEQQKND